MGQIFVIYTAVTAVANDAADLTMSILEKICILQEDLLPNLQRREFATSALAGCFTGRRFLHHSGGLLKCLFVGMAYNARAGFFPRGSGSVTTPGNHNDGCYG